MPDTQIKVLLTRGREPLGRYVLKPGAYLVGRDPACDIVVDCADVSQRHARLSVTPEEVRYEDLGSSNGSFVVGERINAAIVLRLPQQVRLGSVVLEIDWAEASEPGDGGKKKAVALSREEALRVGEHYRASSLVARGGMGAIHEAEDLHLGRTVAMKRLLSGSRASPDSRQRFLREAEILGRLEHPNIVPVHDLCIDEEGELFYTMKFVKGVTLHQVLDEIQAEKAEAISKYPLANLLTIFQKVCDAVSFAHARGVVHRDLKPENIMVGDFGEVLVMDWGLAKTLKAEETSELPETRLAGPTPREGAALATMEGRIMGTPNYMAPEQAEGRIKDIDPRTDIYGLGGVLYALLTLRPPIKGNDLGVILERIRCGDIRPPTEFNQRQSSRSRETAEAKAATPVFQHCPGRKIPQSLSAVAMKALSVKPARRYQTVPELQKDIQAFQTDFAPAAEQAGIHILMKLWVRRHRTASAGFVIVAFLTALLVVQTLASKYKIESTLRALRATAPHFAQKSRDLVARYDFPGALTAVDRAIAIIPEEADYRVLRGNILESLLRFQEAEKEYATALKRNTNQPIAAENLKLCRDLLKFDTLDARLSVPNLARLRETMCQQERFEEAQAMLQRQLAKDQELRTVHLKKWREHLDKLGVKGTLTVTEEGMLALDLSYSSFENLALLKGVPVNELNLVNTKVKDLSPLPGLPLRSLTINGAPVSDIRSLKGMQLDRISLINTEVRDLSPLRGMPLKVLGTGNCDDFRPLRGMQLVELSVSGGSEVTDLAPLRGMPLKRLALGGTKVADLSPLDGMALEFLDLGSTLVRNLNHLQGMPLRQLILNHTEITAFAPLQDLHSLTRLSLGSLPITDLSFLLGKPLRSLDLSETAVTDLAPLKGMPLTDLNLSKTRISDLRPLIGMKNLQSLTLDYTRVTNLEPLRFFPLRTLNLEGMPIKDINALKGLTLSSLNLSKTKVRDLSPLNGMPLDGFNVLSETDVSDLSPLSGKRITSLMLDGTQVSDLSPLRGMPLRHLHLHNCLRLEDLSPLSGCMELEELTIPIQCRNIEFLRQLPKLRMLGQPKVRVADTFWKEYDKQKAAENAQKNVSK